MCTYDICVAAMHSFQSKKEWIAHQNSHKTSENDGSDVDTCPFCLKEFESNRARFHSHVAHHMEDIRLFSLPPSHRQSDDVEGDDLGLGNSSGTGSGYILSDTQSKFSLIAEEGPSGGVLENSLKQKLKTYDQPDKLRIIGDWLSSGSDDEV